MNRQKMGLYVTYGGYAAGVVAIILAAHHWPILIAAAVSIVAVFVGRQMEKSAGTTAA